MGGREKRRGRQGKDGVGAGRQAERMEKKRYRNCWGVGEIDALDRNFWEKKWIQINPVR